MDPWDAEKILDMYIHDYMIKKNMHKTAEIFSLEANVLPTQLVINPPYGFLMEWWALFWEVYCSRLQNNPEVREECSSEAADATWNSAQNFFPMLLRPPLNQQAIGSMPQNPFGMLQRPELNQQTMNVMQTPCPMPNPELDQQRFAQFPAPPELIMQQGQPISTVWKLMYEQEFLRRSARDMAGIRELPDVGKMNPMLASSSKLSFPQLQNPENIQQWLGRDDRHGNLERSSPVVPNRQEASQATLPKREIPDADAR